MNYEYDIVAVHANQLTLQVCGSDITLNVDINIIKNNCTYDYCRTCHSFQGASIEGNMCIFDCDFHYVNRYWLWTAITRAKQLDCVYFFMNDNRNEKHENKLVDCYLTKKVAAYKKQDARANRIIDVNIPFVSEKWLSSCFGKCCSLCGATFSYDIHNGAVSSNLTANRVDNSLHHYVNNIQPLCKVCNCSLSNK